MPTVATTPTTRPIRRCAIRSPPTPSRSRVHVSKTMASVRKVRAQGLPELTVGSAEGGDPLLAAGPEGGSQLGGCDGVHRLRAAVGVVVAAVLRFEAGLGRAEDAGARSLLGGLHA